MPEQEKLDREELAEEAQPSQSTVGNGNRPDSPSKGGGKILVGRRITLTLVFAAVVASLAFDTGLGTPSSFGVSEFFLLCPLGGLEAMLASKSFIPVAAISMGIVLLFSLVFGRAWCAWGCPAPVIRRFFKRDPERNPRIEERSECSRSCATSAWSLAKSLKAIGKDKRTWVLIAVLIAALIAGFPFFCLFCPIGLTFGSVGSLWHLIVDKQVTASVVVFPLALAVELVAYRKWCTNLCPVAGLLGMVGQFAVFFRPRIDASTCLRCQDGVQCDVCYNVCSESIDKHSVSAAQQLGTCTRCGECVGKCPTQSIKISFEPGAPIKKS